MNSIKSDEFTKQSESFEKSIKKDLSKYLIIKDGLLSEKTGQLIIKNIQ